jgi:serine/threonine protein kinase
VISSATRSSNRASAWEAWDERLRRRVALKRLQPQAGLGEGEVRLAAERAMREARITAWLHHPPVPVYEVVDDEGAPCLLMQYHPAKSMQRPVEEQGTLSVAAVTGIGAEIGAALSAAHEAGIVHGWHAPWAAAMPRSPPTARQFPTARLDFRAGLRNGLNLAPSPAHRAA